MKLSFRPPTITVKRDSFDQPERNFSLIQDLALVIKKMYVDIAKAINQLYTGVFSDTYVWEDMLSPIISAGRRGIASDFDWTDYNATGIYQPDFALNEDGIVNFHITHDVKPGGQMYPHVHWSASGTDTNPVHWELNYIYAARDDASPVAFSAVQTITLIGVNPGNAFSHFVTETPDIDSVVIPEVDSILCMQVKRVTNGVVDNTDTIFGHFVDIHYQKDRNGTPNKAPDFYT